MHPDDQQLASYLDMPHDAPNYAELRAHVLTCRRCAERLAALRADAVLIADTLARIPVPPLASPGNMRRRTPRILALGLASIFALAVALVGAIFVADRAPGTAGRTPARLVIADEQGGQLVILDAATGAQLAETPIGQGARALAYDAARQVIYVRDGQRVTAVAASSLAKLGSIPIPAPMSASGFVLDAPHGRLFVAANEGVVELTFVDKVGQLVESRRVALPEPPGALALSPDGRRLYAWLARGGALAVVDLERGTTSTRPFDDDRGGRVLLATTPGALLMLRAGGPDARTPVLRSLDPADATVRTQITLSGEMPAWDLAVLSDGTLAVARGDGYRGGVERFAPDTLAPLTTFHIGDAGDAGSDQHTLVAGPQRTLVAIDWLHGTVTRYDERGAPLWQISRPGWRPRAGVFVDTP